MDTCAGERLQTSPTVLVRRELGQVLLGALPGYRNLCIREKSCDHTKNIIDITKEKQTDHCITSVYMKQNDKIEKGIQLFNNIVSMIPEEKKIQVLYHQTLL